MSASAGARGRLRDLTAAEPSRVERWLVAGLLLWLFVGARIEVPALRGIRIEDLAFLALLAFCALHVRALGRPTAPTFAIGVVALAGLTSTAVASARGTVDPVTAALFAMRPLEYWIAFPAALLLLRSADGRWLGRMDRLFAIVTILQTAFAVLQYYLQVPVGFSHAAYSRAAGLTVGPYELGAMSAAFVVYWLGHHRYVLASVATISLAASVSRVSILGAAVAVAVLVVHGVIVHGRRMQAIGPRQAFRTGRPSVVQIGVRALAAAVAALALAIPLGLVDLPAASPTPVADQPEPEQVAPPAGADSGAPEAATPADPTAPRGPGPDGSLAKRLGTTSVLGSWSAAEGLAARVPPVRTASKYQSAAYDRLGQYVDLANAQASGAEPSNLVRFFRWHLILDTFDDPVDILFGLGPSFVGPSVDGSYLRFFADGGLLGVLVWLVLCGTWFRRTPLWMRCVTLSMLVCALFIDILYAERPMALFWTLLAVATVRASAEARTNAGDG